MKSLISSLFVIIQLFAFGKQPITVTSEIKKVTVFTQGAQVERTATTTLQKGDVVVVFENVSPNLDEKSIQFSSDGDYSVLSVSFQVYFEANDLSVKNSVVAFNDQLKKIDDSIKAKKGALSVLLNEEQVLLNNTDFGGADGVNVAELQRGVDLVKSRLSSILKEKQRVENEIDDLSIQKQIIVNKLQKIRLENSRRKGKVIIKLNSEKSQEINATLNYVVSNAGWSPYYDLKVEDIDKPLEIIYKAKVFQNTGEDWEKVKLSLSTGDPYQDGSVPQLNPWFLNFTSNYSSNQSTPTPKPQTSGVTGSLRGIVLDKKTGEVIPFANVVAYSNQQEVVAGTTSDVDGNFILDIDYPANKLEVSFIGYHKHSENISRTDKFYNILLNESAELLSEVVISYGPPLIDKTKSSKITTSEDIVNMAVRDVSTIAHPSAGVTNIKGARGSGTVYFIDGVKVRGSSSNDEVFKISQNQVTLNYNVELPYDIPSDGEQYKVLIKKYTQEVEYAYKAVPKLSGYAYLIANVTDWEKLNLRNGEAGLYYNGNYLGESFLNLDKAEDTLQISLGKDENILVLRNTIKQEYKKGLFGKAQQNFHFRISVRNNKASSIQLEIID